MMFNDLMHEIKNKVSSSVNIKRLKQNAAMNCLPASGEVVSSALGNEKSQDVLRAAAGGDAETDMLYDKNFWQSIYSNETGHTAEGLSSKDINAISKLKTTLSNGGIVTLSLSASHSVVVESITITLNENNIFQKMQIRVMDPAYGSFSNINFNNKSSLSSQLEKKVTNFWYITK